VRLFVFGISEGTYKAHGESRESRTENENIGYGISVVLFT